MMNRRFFLQTTGLAAGGVVLPGPTWATSVAGRAERLFTMDLAPWAIGVQGNLPEVIRLAGAYGFESVAPDGGFLAGVSDAERADLLEELENQGLVWGAATLPVDFRGEEATFLDEVDALPRIAAGLQRAGATRVGTWIRPSHPTLTYRANFDQHVERLGAVADVLGEHGLRLGLEYVGPKLSWTASTYAFIHTMAETKELIAAMGRPNVGFVLDSWHWYTAAETVDDLTSLTNEDVVAVDLNDAPPGLTREQQMDLQRALPASTGVVDITSFLNALVAIGYAGPVRAEPFDQNVNELPDEEAVAVTAGAMKKAFAMIG